MDLESIRKQFKIFNDAGMGFEGSILPLIYDWESATKDPLDMERLDKLAIMMSPFRQSEIINSQIQAANDWRDALESFNLSPLDAIQGASQVLRQVKADTEAKT